ncbi:MAG: hypothetical protein V2A54_10080 [Bacteroidota bacterium]
MKNILLILTGVVFFNTAYSQTKTLTSNGSLKDSKSPIANIIELIPQGATVTLLDNGDNGYYYVKYGNKKGYLNEVLWTGRSISNIETNRNSNSKGNTQNFTTNNNTSSKTKTLTSEGVLKEEKGPLGKIIQFVPSGSTIQIFENAGSGYYKVKYDNKVGFLNEVFWAGDLVNNYSTNNNYDYSKNTENRNDNNNYTTNTNNNFTSSSVIKMTKTESGLLEVPVVINGVLKIFFIMDSGASEVSI